MDRYAVIHTVMPREFVLLQGQGCKWKQCTFCDYHTDVSEDPFSVNREVLAYVTGIYGVLDVINSGSAIELDGQTIKEIKRIVKEKNIHTLWFEAHYMYRHKLEKFAEQFDGVDVKFRCGIESFDGALRELWKKGVSSDVTVEDVAKYEPLAIGFNCSYGVKNVVDNIELLTRFTTIPTYAAPSAGIPDAKGRHPETAKKHTETLRTAAERGILSIVGGCCGTTAEYTRSVAQMARHYKPRKTE